MCLINAQSQCMQFVLLDVRAAAMHAIVVLDDRSAGMEAMVSASASSQSVKRKYCATSEQVAHNLFSINELHVRGACMRRQTWVSKDSNGLEMDP